MHAVVMSDSSSQPQWYLIQCKPREDQRALENLERQGFQCYRPIHYVERMQRGRRYQTEESLFPGYLFIRLDRINDNWRPIRSTRGVNHIVRFNDYPLPVADEIIEQIQQRLAGKPLQEPYLKPGERVRITEGSFSNLEAIFVANDGDQRVVLLLNILQKDQELSFPVQSVRKVSKGS